VVIIHSIKTSRGKRGCGAASRPLLLACLTRKRRDATVTNARGPRRQPKINPKANELSPSTSVTVRWPAMNMLGCTGPPTPEKFRMYHNLDAAPASLVMIGPSATVFD
jgi:hypothetical protein